MKRTVGFTALLAAFILNCSLFAEASLKLWGTVEAGQESRALLEVGNGVIETVCAQGRECRQHRCSCEIGNATITQIGHEHIWLVSAGRRVRLGVGTPLSAEPPKPASPEQNISVAAHVRILRRELSREKWLSSFRENGNARERLSALLASLGLRTDDRIIAVQGQEFQEQLPWKSLAEMLQTARELRVEIERAGRPVLFRIELKE